MADERGAQTVGTKGVGGLDMGTQLTGLFAKLNENNEELFQRHLDVLTAMQKKLMGDYGTPQGNAFQMSQGVSGAFRGARMLGGPPVGVTTADSLSGAPTPPPIQTNGTTTKQDLEESLMRDAVMGGAMGEAMGHGGGRYNGGGGSLRPAPVYTPTGGAAGGNAIDSAATFGWMSHIPVLDKIPGVSQALGLVGGILGAPARAENWMSDEYRNQMNKNLWYRSNAGLTGMQAIQSRLAGQVATSDTLNPMDILSHGERQQSWEDALSMGYRSNDSAGHYYNAQSSMDIDRLAKQALGFSVGQSDAMKSEALQTGGESGLTGLISALSQLQDVAGKAGANVQQMTATAQVYGQQMQQMFGGTSTAAGQFGAQLATQQAQYGTQGVSANPFANQNFNVMATAMSGGTLGQMYSGLLNQQGLGQQSYKELSAAGGNVDSLLRGYLGGAYNDFKNNLVPSVNADPQNIRTLVIQWLQSAGSQIVAPQSLPGLAQMFGGNSKDTQDPVGALVYIIQTYYGAGSLLGKAKTAAQSSATTNAAGVITSGQFAGQQSPDGGMAGAKGGAAITKANATLGADYTSYSSKNGYSPGLATFLSNVSSSKSAKILIHTKNGPVEVTPEELLTKYQEYIPQVLTGEASAVDAGSFSGQTLGDMASGMLSQDSATQSAAAASADTTIAGKKVLTGKDLSNALKSGNGKGTSNAKHVTVGGVQITLDPKVAQLFNLKNVSGTSADSSSTPRGDLQTVGHDALHLGLDIATGGLTGSPVSDLVGMGKSAFSSVGDAIGSIL